MRTPASHVSRKTLLVWLVAGLLVPAALVQAAVAQEGRQRTIDVRIAKRTVIAPKGAIRITEGDEIKLRWTSDEPVELHLHGYNLTIHVRPDAPAEMVVDARYTGRFPVTSHGWGEDGHGHQALTYLEVYPR